MDLIGQPKQSAISIKWFRATLPNNYIKFVFTGRSEDAPDDAPWTLLGEVTIQQFAGGPEVVKAMGQAVNNEISQMIDEVVTTLRRQAMDPNSPQNRNLAATLRNGRGR